ncbi:3',5'-cyclic-nucleotide phosphodiesterase [Nitrincola schmidtii]|uniref:3',5'-cyclic-nucleotide phosphodiesterase n=1 Tax=Nitrincola schmidtii TaxID=1730894 RepID=UPI00124CCE73|nr:3',5'-cyclic-nucleotide phosphodiesterase [Nitrincola schmidtii]
MKIEVLGCSGGMGKGESTTCIRINDNLLIDAGSGLGRLSQQEMLSIEHVFLTHAHLDHICFLPLLLDNLFEQLEAPLQVYALPEVIKALQTHIFNWSIWPDFSQLPNATNAVLKFNPIVTNQQHQFAMTRLTAISAQHVVPACGYIVQEDDGAVFCFSGDTRFDQQVTAAYNQLGAIDALMLECAFPDRLADIAIKSQHLTPASLAEFILSLDTAPKQLWITHLKPSFRDEIWGELMRLNLPVSIRLLSSGDTFFLEHDRCAPET